MSTDTPNSGSTTDSPESRNISLHWDEELGGWSAVDEDLGVASQGETREKALEMLDEAVALHKGEIGESIDSWDEEKAVLEEFGLDPAEVKESREEAPDIPEFMQE